MKTRRLILVIFGLMIACITLINGYNLPNKNVLDLTIPGYESTSNFMTTVNELTEKIDGAEIVLNWVKRN